MIVTAMMIWQYLSNLSKKAFSNHISYHQVARPEYSVRRANDVNTLSLTKWLWLPHT